MSFLSEEQQSYLRNPFYSALTTRQSHFGERIKNVLRYRPFEKAKSY